MIRYKEYLVGNQFVKALVTKPEDNFRTLAPVRSLIHVPIKYNLAAGSILKENQDPLFLLASHHNIKGHNVFLGLAINCQIKLTTTETEKHPVTKLETNRISRQIGYYPAVQDIVDSREDDNLTYEKKVFYLANKVTTNDLINDVRVKVVNPISGIYRVEAF